MTDYKFISPELGEEIIRMSCESDEDFLDGMEKLMSVLFNTVLIGSISEVAKDLREAADKAGAFCVPSDSDIDYRYGFRDGIGAVARAYEEKAAEMRDE